MVMHGNSRITGCSSYYGAVQVAYGGSFIMADTSSITNCTATTTSTVLRAGGGVYVSSGTFTMKDNSSITDCSSNSGTGGVVVASTDPVDAFTMEGNSKIENCTATQFGGGVYVAGSTVTMKDNSSISGCTAPQGAGIYLDGINASGHTAKFNFTSGSITGNHAADVGGGIYLEWFTTLACEPGAEICNNTADNYAADLCLLNQSTYTLAPAKGSQTVNGKSHPVTGWYTDNRSRHSTERFYGLLAENQLTGTSSRSLVASYVDEHLHTVTITDPTGEHDNGFAYYEEAPDTDLSGSDEGAMADRKVYLKYWGGETFDKWTSEDVEIHDANKAEGAWFTMPDTNVTIYAHDHHEHAVMKTSLDGMALEPGQAAEFTLTTTPNNEYYWTAKGTFTFEGPGKVEKLEYHNDTACNYEDVGDTWFELTPSADGKTFVFSEHFDDDCYTGEEDDDGYFDLDDMTYTFRITVTEPGRYTMNAALEDVYPDEDEDPLMATTHAVFTVGMHTVTLLDEDNETLDTLTAAAGDTVALNDPASLPEGKMVSGWKAVEPAELEVTKGKDGRWCFVMPDADVTLQVQLKDIQVDPDQPADDGASFSPAAAVGAVAVAAAGGAVLGAATYAIGTEAYLESVLPAGFAIPTSRQALATLLWTDAGKPEPVSTVLYPDVDADDADAQKAGRWCVEQGLLKDRGEETFCPALYVTRVQVIKAWNAAQKLKNN